MSNPHEKFIGNSLGKVIPNTLPLQDGIKDNYIFNIEYTTTQSSEVQLAMFQENVRRLVKAVREIITDAKK